MKKCWLPCKHETFGACKIGSYATVIYGCDVLMRSFARGNYRGHTGPMCDVRIHMPVDSLPSACGRTGRGKSRHLKPETLHRQTDQSLDRSQTLDHLSSSRNVEKDYHIHMLP